MNLDYAQIFETRGHLYHRAMQRWPAARRHEFQRLFDRYPVRAGQTVLDVPAGGGYLAGQLPTGTFVTARELASGFGGSIPVLAEGDWSLARHDHVVCLAALHHIPDQPRFIERLFEHLAPGGVLHIADVALGSPHSRFLDGFVGRYNLTGHQGTYLDADALPLTAPVARHVTRVEDVACPWVFASRTDLLDFCTDLFGLVDCPADLLEAELAERIGIREAGGEVELAWRLTYIDIHLP